MENKETIECPECDTIFTVTCDESDFISYCPFCGEEISEELFNDDNVDDDEEVEEVEEVD